MQEELIELFYRVGTTRRITKEVKAALLMTEKAARVFVGAVAVGGPVFLPPHQVARIAGRTDEHYRQQMMEATQPDDH